MFPIIVLVAWLAPPIVGYIFWHKVVLKKLPKDKFRRKGG